MSQHRPYDVVGLGSVVVDHQMVLSEFPSPNSKVEAHGEHLQVGGPVPTALVQLARWGKNTAFIGSWGEDVHGNMIAEDLTAEHVNISHATVHPDGRSGVAQVWVDESNGSRTIACHRSSHEVQPLDLPATTMIHLDGTSNSAAIAAAETVREHGGIVVMDSGSPKAGNQALFSLVDILICPAHFMERTFHHSDAVAGAQHLLDLGIKIVLHTQGQHGVEVYLPERQFHQPAYPIEPIDTTGAGDIFSAGILYGTLESWPIEQSVKFAAAAAAFKCQGMGNRAALPELHEVNQLLDSFTTLK